MNTAVRLNLTLLGGFRAQLGDGGALVLPTKKAQALLAYLAVPVGRAHPREKLATLFWGDMQNAQARGNLRHALSRIRAAMPRTTRAAIVLDGMTAALEASAVAVDVALFERLVADGTPQALEQVSSVYGGDLLAGLSLDERPFDEWLTAERERLHELAIQSLVKLLGHQHKAGAEEPAVNTALRLLALDRLQEPVHRTVMRLYARLGRRGAALRQYEACVAMLKQELHTTPEAETTRLYESILRSPSARVAGIEPSPVGSDVEAPTPPIPSERASTNLPAPTSELIGREAALADVAGLLRTHRLVTLVGAGGVGKTRLSVEVARHLLPTFADGAWIAELAALSDPELVHVSVAAALGLELPPGARSPERVAAALGTREFLVVLDNCEHVVDAAAHLVETLLGSNPHVRLIATSREPLRVAGEVVYRLPSLEVPAEDNLDPDDVLRHSSVRLFVARAYAAAPGSAPDARLMAATATICRRLDGIPLAIELAAARVSALGVDGIADRLDDRFRLLTSGRRTALARQQTLRATLDWSYELLSKSEQMLLRRLAVFAGSFTLDSASAIAASPDVAGSKVVECLANLVNKSLLSAEVGGAVAHYRLLETTRAYARETLVESGELNVSARRHAQYYRELFERAEAEWETRPVADWLTEYGRQIDNLRAALDWAFSPDGDPAIGVPLAAAAVPLWIQLSLMDECHERVETALSRTAGESSRAERAQMRLHAALGLSRLYTKGNAAETTSAWTDALAIAERLGDTEYQLRALYGLWTCRVSIPECQPALALAQRFFSVAAKQADSANVPIGARMIGVVLHFQGDQIGARHHIERMLDGYVAPVHRSETIRFQVDQRVAARAFLARVLSLQGFAEQARGTAQNNVDEARATGHPVSLCYALEAASAVALFAADLSAAERSMAMLRAEVETHGFGAWNAWAKCLEGTVHIQRGEAITGTRLLRAALEELRGARFAARYTQFLGALAEGLGLAGQLAEGLASIDEALERSEHNDERWCEAELLRIKGELLLLDAAPGAEAAAEDHFSRALASARRQGALSWELRSSMSLARLWHRQDRTGSAHELLAPVYGRFTEGFDTVDLKTAKALLVRLTP